MKAKGKLDMCEIKKERIRVVSLCSGIGCQERGLLNTPCFEPEIVATSEIDRYAIVSYAAIHNGLTNEMIANYDYPPLEEMAQYLTDLNIGYIPEKDKKYDWFKSGKKFEEQTKKVWLSCQLNKNVGDINRVEGLPEADVWFCSFPCQSISIAGKLRGMNPDSGTRSSLVWQTIRLLKRAQETNTLPKYMALENVKNLVGKKFIKDFETFNELVSEFGYNVKWEIINAKNCGVPQNRERVFAIYIRKDIDTGNFTFPKPFDNGLRLKHVLEEKVDEKYYINTDKAQELIQKLLDDGVIGNEDVTEIDLSVNNPKHIEIANCVSARTDRGISNRRAEGSGVCVKQDET